MQENEVNNPQDEQVFETGVCSWVYVWRTGDPLARFVAVVGSSIPALGSLNTVTYDRLIDSF